MRTIKFKGKRLDNGEWLEGYYRGNNEGKAFISRIKRPPLFFAVDPETVCQFTGLTDCEGNEIWEGDILEGESKCEIVFFKGTFAIRYINSNGKECVDPLHYFIKEDGTVECKVIGNKFDKISV